MNARRRHDLQAALVAKAVGGALNSSIARRLTVAKKDPSPKKQTKKAAKKTATVPARNWRLGLFQRARGEGKIVAYVDKTGAPRPYQRDSVKGKASIVGAYTECTFAEARAALLKEAGAN